MRFASLTASYEARLATRMIAAMLRSTSSSRVAQDETLMRIAVRPCHTVPPHQHVPSDWMPAMTH